jgi:hypothetical protein
MAKSPAFLDFRQRVVASSRPNLWETWRRRKTDGAAYVRRTKSYGAARISRSYFTDAVSSQRIAACSNSRSEFAPSFSFARPQYACTVLTLRCRSEAI